nr:hypothetical protein [Tanacetum cinerariifolium]
MESCDPVGTLMEIKDKLDLDQNGTPVDAMKYRSMIGALMYLTSSRPDIVHATCLCTRYQAKPTEKHLKEVKRIFPLAISCNPIQHSRTKHIDVRYHFIKEHVEKGTIELYFVKTDYQLADIFTRALPADHFNYLVRRLGFIDADYPSHVYKLKKVLYGLKQVPRAWYDELSTFLLQNEFSKGTIDPTLFTKRFDDNILVSKYVHEILKKYGLNTYDIIGTLMDIKDKLDLDQIGTPVDATKYRSLIGALMYLTSSRPDIVHATCVCARYQAHPTEKHLKEVKRIFRYLRGTDNTGL